MMERTPPSLPSLPLRAYIGTNHAPIDRKDKRTAGRGCRVLLPGDPTRLRTMVQDFLDEASGINLPAAPKALIVPHAGYIYSGSVAAAAYASIAARRDKIKRVVLLGPSHRVYLQGVAISEADEFATPLGNIRIDREGKAQLLSAGNVVAADAPHAMEHSLEVQLPFLQALLGDFTLVPLVAGAAKPQHVASILASVWGDEDTLVLISSDLSHYHSYEVAQQIDQATSRAILRYATNLSGEQACGAVCINGLLHLANERGLPVTEVKRLNSGDTAGDRSRVVGYGAFAIHASGQFTAS